MESASEPASNRSKPCASLKKPREPCLFAAPYRPSKEENRLWSDISFFLRNLPVSTFDSRAQEFSTPLALQLSSWPLHSPNLVRTYPKERYQTFRDSAPCLSRVTTPRRAPNWSSEEARIWEHHPQPTIPPPRLNRSAVSQR